VYWRDVCALYAGDLDGRSPAPARYAYRDFGRAEQHLLEEQLDEGLRFWTEMLRGAEAAEWRPPARAGRRSSVSGARLDFAISKRGADAVRALAAECGATPFMALFAAYAWLLHQVTTAANPVIGMSVGLRDRVEFEQSVGYHANMNAIRCSCEGNPTFAEQVRRIRDVVLEADGYRWVPFHRVVKAVNPLRRGKGNPLFQSAIVLHDDKDLSRPLAGGAVAKERRWHNGTSKFDLLLEVGLRPDSVQCALEYALDVLDHRDASAFAAMFEAIVERAAEDPELRPAEAAAVSAGDMAAAG
jgi:non-ribosomal peptide synthetase component F